MKKTYLDPQLAIVDLKQDVVRTSGEEIFENTQGDFSYNKGAWGGDFS